MVICIYDNRPDSEIGIRLLLESLCRHSPDCVIHVYFAPASSDLTNWITEFPNIKLIIRDFGPLHWNIKPIVLLEELRICDEIVWLDSDVLVAASTERIFFDLDPDTIVIAEEALWGRKDAKNKAESWGFAVGRSFDVSLNTCVVRLTRNHMELLRDWQELLQSETYLSAQAIPYQKRPGHLFGDQDVLMALLSSEKYSHLPVKILRRGPDILQAFGLKGFTVRERLIAMRKMPVFVHAQGQKPWIRERPNTIRDYIEVSYRDASPFVILANREKLKFEANTSFGKLLRVIGFGSAPFTGLPLAILFDIGFEIARLLRKRKLNARY
jgi:hypothetical protein